MNVNSIGTYAGTVWQVLNSNGGMAYEDLKRITKLRDCKLATGIGWLARENKVTVENDIISLV